ncbi:MAG: ParB/RepB/Spo0J family partition protein [Candidatus Viridilinea halotolerans]|uniref:ParB/RepB/Spo0J family partition protein n=1 Tax=Candidatus Viridilinea halotolerans TaxID=2491704 RepID=A0A426U3M1_9CHLR|nr:MAG: ParB/RepB/Spo0J family partition protein [Candidatus Viridilinea halotolerans]
MPPRRSSGFFSTPARPEDDVARMREVEALLAPQRTLVQDLPAERIRPNPFQARVTFNDLEELSAAIQSLGFTSRLRVRPDPTSSGFFQLVYGERRLRAARLAGIALIPCEIAEHSDDELLEIGLAENIQRQDLNPLEEAQAFARFIEQRNYSIRRLAERIGKDKGYIENRLVLLRMPPDIQAMVAQRPDSLMAARELARLDDPALRAPLIDQILRGALATASLRTIVRQLGESNEDQPDSTPMGASNEKQPSGSIPMGASDEKQPSGSIPMGASNEKQPVGSVPMGASDEKQPSGSIPVGASDEQQSPDSIPLNESNEQQPIGSGATVPTMPDSPMPRYTAAWGIIQRDHRRINNILTRWEDFATSDPTSAAAIAPAINEFIERLERLTELLKQS